MSEHEGLIFLLSLAALLGVARLLGELGRSIGLPLVAGEISAGLLLGPTVLGRVAPSVHTWLFSQPTSQKMLAAYTTVAAVLLLVVAGLEVDLSVIKRRGRSALLTSILGIVFPMGGGIVLGLLLPASDLASADSRVLFALFIGVALSISALPVIAKTLLDLGLFKTDIGLLVMAAAMVDDVIGWLAFSLLLGPMRGHAATFRGVAMTALYTIAFVTFCLVIGRRVVDRLLRRLEGDAHSAGSRILSLVILLALFGASATQAIGIHAVFGAFMVGVTFGDSPHLKERTRSVIHQFVTNIFAPVFFASLGLRTDFARSFDLRLCILVFTIATIAKAVGCTLGARAGGLGFRESAAVGFGLNARGAMEIILAQLALEAGLIKEQVFVALVVMAIATSLVSGPVMKQLLYRRREEDVVALLRRGAFLPKLEATTPTATIHALVEALSNEVGDAKERAKIAVIERELVAPTGLGDGVAIPHAAVEGLSRPVLALACSENGIDFDGPDGRPARILFLLLIPPKAYDQEVRILASIARSIFDESMREALLGATTLDEAANVLEANARRTGERHPGRTVSLADM